MFQLCLAIYKCQYDLLHLPYCLTGYTYVPGISPVVPGDGMSVVVGVVMGVRGGCGISVTVKVLLSCPRIGKRFDNTCM